MYTTENYIWGLVAYGLGVLLVMPAMFKVTALVMPWRPLRVLLRLVFIVLLVTPVYAYQDSRFLAPAWIVAAFESIQASSPEGPALALTVLTGVFTGLLVLTIVWYLARYLWRRRRQRPARTPEPSA